MIPRNKRAVGVEFSNDKFTRPNSDPTTVFAIRASRLIVLSAGAMGSPAILERSGIGAAERLRNLGIPAIVDLPGVGENYQGIGQINWSALYSSSIRIAFMLDHLLIMVPYFIDPSVETYDAVLRGDPQEIKSKNLFSCKTVLLGMILCLRTARYVG